MLLETRFVIIFDLVMVSVLLAMLTLEFTFFSRFQVTNFSSYVVSFLSSKTVVSFLADKTRVVSVRQRHEQNENEVRFIVS